MGMTIDTSLLYESGYNKGFKDGIKGSIPKADYENRLKADLKAILVELQLEIEELQGKYSPYYDEASKNISWIIQEKINVLRGEEDGNDK